MKLYQQCIVILIMILALGLSSCSYNKPVEPVQDGMRLPSGPTTIFTNLDLPAWLLFPPQGEYAIGVAGNNTKKPQETISNARSFAAASLAQNRCFFDYTSADALKYLAESNHLLSSFSLPVKLNPDTEYEKNIEAKLITLAETSVFGSKLILMGTEKTDLNYDNLVVSASTAPYWCKTQKPYSEGGFDYVIGMSEQPELVTAWQEAQKYALRKLALWRLDSLPKVVQAEDNDSSQLELIETAKVNPDASIAKIWLYHKTVAGVPSYSVFIMLKARQL